MTEISAAAYAKLQGDLRQLDEEILEIEKRLQAAVSHGDISENTEYDAEKANMTSKQNLKLQLEQTLRTAKVVQGYSTNISVGTLISIKQLNSKHEVIEDMGLLMFDEVGDIVFDGKIKPDSDLGRAIQGTEGGIFEIQDRNGSVLIYSVTVEPESRLEDFLRMYSKNKKEKLKEMFTIGDS